MVTIGTVRLGQRTMLALTFTVIMLAWWKAYSAAAQFAARLIQPAENTLEKTIAVDGRQRTYYLHVPPDLSADKPVPLVLVFHGGGGTALGMERYLSRFSKLADQEHFLVAYPEGIDKSWNDGRGDTSTAAARQNVDDLAFVMAMLAAIGQEHQIDPQRIYATGISNGAIFSNYLAANHADKIAAIAPVVGSIADPFYKQFKPSEPVSVFILQGTKDPLVPYNGGLVGEGHLGDRCKVIATNETVKLWVQNNGCEPTAVEKSLPDVNPDDGCTIQQFTYGQGRNGTEVVLYKIEGGGHTWPGGPQYFPKFLIGSVCRDIDGTQVIWDFFKAHPKLPS
ncbi:MAG TPA: PHB depolymerase family esterase [Pirellulales bacterium]|jgi:polyhydroxybutyrate depolymerase|nr:PHB depolymerase family esterase [Pirellulales bacterium]